MSTTDLQRFVAAQDEAGSYESALQELATGRKTTHWMWFIFPQITGLGRSATAQFYAISSLSEARDYLAHPVLGPRLLTACKTLLSLEELSAVRILGQVDAQKLSSSMTLFLRANPREDAFRQVVDRYFDGELDAATDRELDRLAGQ